MVTIALIEVTKLTDGSKVYDVQIRNGSRVVCTIETESRDAAMAMAASINTGATGIK